MKAESIIGRFATSPSLLDERCPLGSLRLEMKPYLQPFERDLALRELRALLCPEDSVTEDRGYWIAHTNTPAEKLRARLTYWQRVGDHQLMPTLQKALELTQVGAAQLHQQNRLHRSRRLRYGPHNIHEYRGKFFPQLVRSLINISGLPEQSLVLDPMCGSGTAVFESAAAGHSAIGVDINPLSILISRAKALTLTFDPNRFHGVAHKHLSSIANSFVEPGTVWNSEDCAYLGSWFDAAALGEVASIISSINGIQEENYRELFRVCISNIIRSISWQRTADLRIRKELGEYVPGDAFKRFHNEVTTQADRLQPYLEVLNFKGKVGVDVRHGNAINLPTMFPTLHQSVDLLITSPPYANALPYIDTDRLSLIALGLLSRKDHKKIECDMIGSREITEAKRQKSWTDFLERRHELPQTIVSMIERLAAAYHTNETGFRRRNLPALLGKYYLAMRETMISTRKLMKPGAPAFFIVGNNSTTVNGNRTEIPTDRFLFDLGEKVGWRPKEQIPMELLVSRDIFRRNRGSAETILCFTA